MKKHKDAIQNIRTTLKQLVGEKAKLRAEILDLKYDASGNRRPDTGPTRHSMKMGYNWATRPEIRATLLAYGLLRGKPYKAMEPKNEERGSYPQLARILNCIHTAIGDNAELKEAWTYDRVSSLIQDGVDTVSEAA